MAKVLVTTALREEIFRIFKAESAQIFSRFKLLESNPKQGKALGHVGGIVIKELRHGKYRFYCITDGHTLKFGSREELAALFIKFVRVSEKKDQQKAIEGIKRILCSMGLEGF